MKLLKRTIIALVILLISVIVFFTWNLIFSFVSNYQSLSSVSFSSIPMVMFMCEIIITLFAFFNKYELKRNDAYFYRKYSITIGVFALIGLGFSIFAGTYIYHTFIGDYVFFAYPLVMTLVHTFVLAACVYMAAFSIRIIVKEKPERTWKNYRFYWVREVLIGQMMIFALEKLGAFVLLPTFWSSYDSVYVIPFYIQLLMPAFVFMIYMIHEHILHNRKITMILCLVALGYTAFSFTYMVVLSHNHYPLTINPLSPILQLERLVTKPYGFIILYGFSFIVPMLTIFNMLFMERKAKKAQK